MVWERSFFVMPAMKAASNISTKQHYCFKMSTDDEEIVICGDGDHVFGILQNKPNADQVAAEVMTIGVSKVEIGSTLTAGDFWGSDSAGKAKPITPVLSGGDIGDFVAGVVVIGGAAASLGSVTIGMHGFQVGA